MTPGGNYYSAAFDFTFEITDETNLTGASAYILGYYNNPGASGGYAANVFTLKGDANGALTLSLDRVYSATVTTTETDKDITAVVFSSGQTLGNSSIFTIDGNQASSAYTLTVGTYKVDYLGGDNDAAAANLYLNNEIVASFTGGSHNMNGGGGEGTNKLTYTVNEDYVKAAAVPEPTTATLSLLALAGLAARRRRK